MKLTWRSVPSAIAMLFRLSSRAKTMLFTCSKTYTLQLAATLGKNVRIGPMKRRRTDRVYEFKYPEPIAHY